MSSKISYSWKEAMRLVLPYLGTISLQTRTKVQKSIKGALNCCKLQVIFKSPDKLCNNFCFKDPVAQILTSVWFTSFSVWLCNESYYRECVRNLAVRSGEHIGISPLTNKRVQPRKDSAVCNHFLNCNHSPTIEDFSVLCHGTKKYLLELKESLLKMLDHRWIEMSVPPIFICLNESLSHCLLRSVNFCDQLFTYFL